MVARAIGGGPELEVIREVTREFGQVTPDWSIKSRPDGDFLFLFFAAPNERLYGVVDEALTRVSEENPFRDRVVVAKRDKKPANVVNLPETKMLQKELSESLTVDRHTFGEDFFARYTPSVTNYETAIIGNANYVVYGRRGSGKSSLLAYAMHDSVERSAPFSWIALQAYGQRSDANVIASVLAEIFRELSVSIAPYDECSVLATSFTEIANGSENEVSGRMDKLFPRARAALASVSSRRRPMTVFLDDIHVLGEDLQPRLLSSLYSLTRGNNSYIKASGIEQFTKIWESSTRTGLEAPHDAQILRLDHNLTMPDLSRKHIVSILDAHAHFCGLPGIAYLAEDKAISRLVLEAAAVPRDALSLFSQAITKSSIRGQKAVTITAMNAAASEAVEEKLKDIGRDAADADGAEIRATLEALQDFCVRQHHTNAFLVRIDSRNNDFRVIQKLIALRFVHILHEGITPHKVAERYQALMLDYGFYIGIRAAASIELFPDTPRILPAKELRKLPIFSSDQPKTKSKSRSVQSKRPRAAVTRMA